VDILFIAAPGTFSAYKASKVRAAVQEHPLLSSLMLAACAREEGFSTSILDLGIEKEPYKVLDQSLGELRPRFVGLTSTTPLFPEVVHLSKIVRSKLGQNVTIIYGGPHATALPEESLSNSEVDIVARGEGEQTLMEILQEKPLSQIAGIYYKEGDNILHNGRRPLIKNLDSLPVPALDLVDLTRYHCSSLIARSWPMVAMETSRGCPNRCTYCNKNISATLFRTKSPEKVVEEIKYSLGRGVREFRITDDQFATDLERAKKICELILKEDLKFTWNLANGVRADRVDKEFLQLAKRAGCYQVAVGFESGDEEALKSVNKQITLEQSIHAMELIREVGIESVGFFMLGLPGDTEKSMQKTIDFANKLMLDFAKATITLPYPGTVLFDDYARKGLIKTRDWGLYNFHNPGMIYDHPNLSFKVINKYYLKFYRSFYLNPKFLRRRLVHSIKNRSFLRDALAGLETFFPRIFPAKPI